MRPSRKIDAKKLKKAKRIKEIRTITQQGEEEHDEKLEEKANQEQSEGAKYYKFNIGKNSILSSRAGVKPIEMNQLTFEATEEIFSNNIVVRIVLTGHALPEVK